MKTPSYSVAIRTLGKAGDKYQKTLDSVATQTHQPDDIIIYIAEGYNIPKETCGKERYVYVPKGMVAQRALQYDEIESEYILFLDDDVYLPPNAVANLFRELEEGEGGVISPSVFANHKASLKHKIASSLTGREIPIWSKKWAYKVLPTGGFTYNNNPTRSVYKSQTNAGPCVLCRKNDFLKIKFEEEKWLDEADYALPEDQVMYYKMYLNGLKVLTSFDSGIVHLDAGSSVGNTDRNIKIIKSEYRNKLIFWYKFLYLPNKNFIKRAKCILGLSYAYIIQAAKYNLKNIFGKKEEWIAFKDGVKDGWRYIKTIDDKV